MAAYIDRSGTFYNHVNHQAYIAAHPTDKNRVLALGGDVIIRSTDGGANYNEVGAGYNGGCWTGMGINLNDPNLIMLSNQDYTGAFSTDGGKTWAMITRTTENNVANEGPYGTSFLRVSPTTRELFTIGSCRGLWKTKP